MNLSDIEADAKSTLKVLAPLIGTAIGGPFGTIAGGLLDEALGTNGDPTATAAKLTTLTSADAAKVQEAEIAFKQWMAQSKVTEDKLRYDDVANARGMEEQTKSTTPTVLSYLVLMASIVCFVGIIAGVFQVPQNPTQAAVFGSVLTYLTTESRAVFGYWFGHFGGVVKKFVAGGGA